MANESNENPVQQALIDAINSSEGPPPLGQRPPKTPPDPGVVKAIAAGASVNERLPNGATPLMWAIANKKPGAVRAILDAGPDLAARDGDGDVALTVATRFAPKDDLTILEMVLDAGADPNARRPNGDPAVTSLMRSFNLDGISLMARRGADMNALTRTGTPLIIEAALLQAWDVVHTLIEGGADALVVDDQRRVSTLMNQQAGAPSDSPIFPWKVKVWHYLASRGEPLSPLPGAS